jgi:multidrug resistance efflux pump
MIELILGTYGVGCWLVFKKFKLVPVTTYTVCTAILGGIVLFMGIMIILSICHPVSHDARFYAPVTQISPQVRGTVTEVPVVPNEPLRQGDVLFRIDDEPYRLEVERLEAMLEGMNSDVAQLEERLASAVAAKEAASANLLVSESEYDRQARIALDQATEQIKQTQSRLELANANLTRYKSLHPKGVVTDEDLEEATTRVKTLNAELAQAKAAEKAAAEKVKSGGDALQAVRAQLAQAEANEREIRRALEKDSEGLTPEVRQTMAELERKRWELEQTVVRAPSDGYATYVALRPGQMATPLPLTAPMVFVPKEKPSLIATFPQNAIAGIEPGLEAELAFKAYPGQIFKAKVLRVLPISPEGQFSTSRELQSATAASVKGQIPVVFEYGDDVAALDLPVGSQASVAVYTHHVHAIAIVRKIILRIKSWENYVFFLQDFNIGH